MKIELELTPEQTVEVVRTDLIESYNLLTRNKEFLIFENQEEIAAALKTVILYYSTPDQQREFLESNK